MSLEMLWLSRTVSVSYVKKIANDQQLVLNTTNVLCITNPSRGVLDYFQTYVENFRTIKNETEDFVSENMDITFSDDDSDLDNLIRFPGSRPDKLH